MLEKIKENKHLRGFLNLLGFISIVAAVLVACAVGVICLSWFSNITGLDSLMTPGNGAGIGVALMSFLIGVYVGGLFQ